MMRIISTNCPYCGASLPIDKDKSSFSCNYCGNTFLLDNEVRHIKYDNAEEAGYQFEKGRQRAQIERSQIQAPLTFKQPDSSKNKSKIWLWVLGWIFIFPLPLTIILLKNKSITPVSKFSKSKSAYKQKKSNANPFFEDIWFVSKAAKNNSCQTVMPITKRDC